jgi:chromosome segregation ATPase
MEKKLAEELRDEIQRLETNIAQAGSDKDVLETKLQEKLAEINMLQEKISSLSQELDDKEKHSRDLSASLSSKEVDYQKLSAFINETKRSLDLANSNVQQLEEELHRTNTDLTSKMSLIDSMNVKLQTLSSEKKEAEKKINELRQEYTNLKADSETRASHDSKLLAERDDQIKQLEEKLCAALTDSSKDHETIAELNKELDATKVMLENELATMEILKASIQSLEMALKDSRSEASVLSKELEEANKSNQDPGITDFKTPR